MEDKIEFVKEKLKFVLECFEVKNFSFDVKLKDNTLYIEILGDELDFLIDKNAELLNSIQYILTIILNLSFDGYLRIILDCNNFRSRRNEYILELCKKLKDEVIKQNHSVTLEPMNPFERRLVHSYISEFDGVYSKSIGKDPNRSVVIYPGYADDFFILK